MALSWCSVHCPSAHAHLRIMHPRVVPAVYGGGALSRAWGTKRLGSMPDPPYNPPKNEECSIASIYPSILSHPAASFPLNSSFAASILIAPSLLLAIPRSCPSTCIHSPSRRATARCPTSLPTLKPWPRLLMRPGLLPVAGHPKAPISSAYLDRLRRTSNMQIA